MAVRYCDNTIRRSSSNQRGSALPDKSMAPPVCQKWFQCICAFVRTWVNVGSDEFISGAKAHTSSKDSEFPPGRIWYSCLAVLVMVASADHCAFTIYRVPSTMRVKWPAFLRLRKKCFVGLRPGPVGCLCIRGAVGKMDLYRQPL